MSRHSAREKRWNRSRAGFGPSQRYGYPYRPALCLRISDICCGTFSFPPRCIKYHFTPARYAFPAILRSGRDMTGDDRTFDGQHERKRSIRLGQRFKIALPLADDEIRLAKASCSSADTGLTAESPDSRSRW